MDRRRPIAEEKRALDSLAIGSTAPRVNGSLNIASVDQFCGRRSKARRWDIRLCFLDQEPP